MATRNITNMGVAQVMGKATWPPEWFDTFKSTFTCKAELNYEFSDFFYPTAEIREHAKAMVLIMGLRHDESIDDVVGAKGFMYKLRIHHAQ